MRDEVHPIINSQVQVNRQRTRVAEYRGTLGNFLEDGFVLGANEEFHGEKLCSCWRGNRRVVKALNDYVFQVNDLRNENSSDVHGTLLKFYSDKSLDQKIIFSHILSSETGIPVSRLFRLVENSDGIKGALRWKGLYEKGGKE